MDKSAKKGYERFFRAEVEFASNKKISILNLASFYKRSFSPSIRTNIH